MLLLNFSSQALIENVNRFVKFVRFLRLALFQGKKNGYEQCQKGEKEQMVKAAESNKTQKQLQSHFGMGVLL